MQSQSSFQRRSSVCVESALNTLAPDSSRAVTLALLRAWLVIAQAHAVSEPFLTIVLRRASKFAAVAHSLGFCMKWVRAAAAGQGNFAKIH